MCLKITNRKDCKAVAEEDIVCYKIVQFSSFGYATTPFQKMKVEIGNTYKVGLPQDFPVMKVDIDIDGWYSWLVGENAFHSFANAKDAYTTIAVCFDLTSTKVVECVIPKGSRYVKGEFDSCSSYASECIKYVKII